MTVRERISAFYLKVKNFTIAAVGFVTSLAKILAILGISSVPPLGVLYRYVPDFFFDPWYHQWIAIGASVATFLLLAIVIFLVRKLAAQTNVGPLFRDLASKNARCDWRIFQDLYADPRRNNQEGGWPSDAKAVGMTFTEVSHNIDDIVDYGADIFSVHTHTRCAVSVKLISGSAKNPKVHGARRDTKSRAERPRLEDDVHDLPANTAFKHIAEGLHDFYVCDDLRAARRREEYDNPRKGWEKDYNATMVFPLRRYPYDQARSNDLLGFLCVDSLKGRFGDETAKHYMIELRDRMEVMFLRFRVLETIIEQKEVRS